MKDFIKKNKIIVSVVIYAATLGPAFYFASGYLLSAINESNTKIQESLVDREVKEKRLAEIPGMKEQYQLVVDGEKSIVPLLTEGKAVELIEKLEKLAQNTGNGINIEIQNGKEKTSASKAKGEKGESEKQSIKDSLPSGDYLKLKINLSGSYNQLLDFVEKFEALEYYSDIVSLDIKLEEKENAMQGGPSLFARAADDAAESGKEQPASQRGELAPDKGTTLNSSIGAVFYLEKNK